MAEPAHFFGLAAQAMRHILVDAARTRRRAKRGGGLLQVSLSNALDVGVTRSEDLVALDDALTALEALNPRHSRVVELRFFGGLSLQEIANVLDVSVGTVRRDWSLARAWLYRELAPRAAGGGGRREPDSSPALEPAGRPASGPLRPGRRGTS